MRRQIALWTILLGVGLLLSGCGLLQDSPPTVTPIFVTATPVVPVVPIVATETPAGPTSVLPSTSAVDLLPTRAAPTATPTTPPPITLTPSFTPTFTDTPVTPGAVNVFAPVGGAGVGSSSNCSNIPSGTFGAIYQSDPEIPAAIGCPLSGVTSGVTAAYQTFESGFMIWLSSLGDQSQAVIYAVFDNGTYQRFNDTFTDGVDPESGGEAPPGGLIEPVRGFGKVWRENPGVRGGLGWATSPENSTPAQVALFERGEMVSVAMVGQTYILATGAPGTWTARAGGS
jgi:hypothetical protein